MRTKAVANAEHRVKVLLGHGARPRRISRAILKLQKRLDAAKKKERI